MTLFQVFRMWAHRAPLAQRVLAAVGAATVAAVLAWNLASSDAGNTNVAADRPVSGLAPGIEGSSDGAPADGQPAGGQPTVQPDSAASSPSASERTTGVTPGSSTGDSSSGSNCASVAGDEPGVTSSTIKIAIILLNIVGPAGNQTFGVETGDEQRQSYQAVIDSINDAGGVACRKLAPLYFTGNSADASNLQQLCFDIAAAKPFAVIDYGAYYTFPQLATCFPQNRLPFFASGQIPQKQLDQFYPYQFGGSSKEVVYRNAVLALKDRGFFKADNGFKKIGVLYTNCIPELPGEMIGYLREAGISENEIVPYNLNCPSAFASPSDLAQAILTFKNAGVTHQTFVNAVADFATFTRIAQQQNYRPKYGFPDEGQVSIASGSQQPDPDNIANALAITADRFSEEKTPGLAPTTGTKRCATIMTAHGRPDPYHSAAGATGQACSQLWLLQGAIANVPTLQRSALAGGLARAGSIEVSYPAGPNQFRDRVTVGGQFWRPSQFLPACACWRVVDATFRPSFP